MWPREPYSLPEDEYRRLMRKLFGPAKPVVHHETCPCCGRKLVNLYRRDKEWKCRLCWEKHDAEKGDNHG